MDIPIVDFHDCSLSKDDIPEEVLFKTGKEVYDAFATVGFVYLSNTGVPGRAIHDAFRVSKQFFNLPMDTKRKYPFDEHYSGYHELYKERTNLQRPHDVKEAFHVGGMALSSGKATWPDLEVAEFSKTMENMYGYCRDLALRIFEVLSVGMKVKDRTYFSRCHSRIGGERNYTTLRTLNYPPLPEDSDLLPGQVRLGEHSDYGSLTLLFQGEVGGLEIENYEGVYIEAKPIPGTVLVNIGDLLQFWTKGRLKSTRHRIMNPKDEKGRKMSRQSMVCFVNPNYEVELSEIEYEASREESRHKPVEYEHEKCLTAVEYNEMMYKKTYQ